MPDHKEGEILMIVLVHVARTWERIRLLQEHQEMPEDNIASVEEIIIIAEEIMRDEIIQEFITTSSGEVWEKTPEGMSDAYIERLATTEINKIL